MEIISNESLSVLTKAEIDVQVATAKQYPRTITEFKERVLSMATVTKETAEACFYALPRAGKTIQGPSVRLAEIITSAWGNIRSGARIIGNDGKVIIAQGICHDLETNTATSIEVRRKITDKTGKTYSEDMQVVAGNAACAVAFRNSVFKVVPAALVQDLFDQIKLVALGDEMTLDERRENAVKYFVGKGISEMRIFNTLDVRKVGDIGVDELTILIGAKNAIEEGSITIDEAFPVIVDTETGEVKGKPEVATETGKAASKAAEAIKAKNPAGKKKPAAKANKLQQDMIKAIKALPEPGEEGRDQKDKKLIWDMMKDYDEEGIMLATETVGYSYQSKEDLVQNAPSHEIANVIEHFAEA